MPEVKAHGMHYVEDWLISEVPYTQAKFGIDADDQHIKEFQEASMLGGPWETWWNQQLENYMHRAHVLGLDTPNGRQALAKFTATAMGMLMAAVRVYGPLPKPGVPSGENLEDLKELY